MTNVLILGANGQIAREATRLFLEQTDARLTLYLRNAKHSGIVSRKSIADLVVKLTMARAQESRQSLGVHKA